MSTDNDFSEMFPQEQWGNFLTPEEQEVFFEWTSAQQEKYLAAQESYEAMQSYLEDPETPEAAKKLLNLDGWK